MTAQSYWLKKVVERVFSGRSSGRKKQYDHRKNGLITAISGFSGRSGCFLKFSAEKRKVEKQVDVNTKIVIAVSKLETTTTSTTTTTKQLKNPVNTGLFTRRYKILRPPERPLNDHFGH
jgi:hypothetical protein